MICNYFVIADKVRHAQNASFDGVIVYNKNSNELEIMSASDDSDIFIPSVFVGQTAGQIILYDYMYINGKKFATFDEMFAILNFLLRLCPRAQRRFPIQHQHAPHNSI